MDPQRLVEAAAWRARLTEMDASTSPDFESWLTADPRNDAAWRQVQKPWAFIGEHANAPEMLELRRAALTAAHHAGRKRWRPASLASRFIRPALVASVLLAVISALVVWDVNRPDVYRTAAGERREITLEDGSRIALDSRSEVRVRFTGQSRELTLAAGQARFDVAHDVMRPFSVVAGGQRVVATGTSFNVDLLGPRVLVTLIEGHVVVGATAPPAETPASTRRRASAPRAIELAAGEQLTVSPEAPPAITPISVERAMAWQSGRLVFESEPLSTVVMRVSRYSARPLRVGDERTSQLRISGVFDAGDVEHFVATITAYLPVSARRAADGALELYSLD